MTRENERLGPGEGGAGEAVKKWRKSKWRINAMLCRLRVWLSLLGESWVAMGSVPSNKSRKSKMDLHLDQPHTG
jgi:hypothetical protein